MNKKSVLIIGGSSDIGIAVAKEYAKLKYKIILAGRDMNQIELYRQSISNKYKNNVTSIELDILNYNMHASFVNSIKEMPFISILAIGDLGNQEIAEGSEELFLRMTRANFEGPALLLNLLSARYKQCGSGVIVGISSIAGLRGRRSNYIYGSSKAAFTQYLSGLRGRMHVAGIRVITIIPGYVNTKMTKSMKLNPILTSSPSSVAKIILKAIKGKKDVVYTSWFWLIIIYIIRIIPEQIFKRINF